jgi:hypothetical protein
MFEAFGKVTFSPDCHFWRNEASKSSGSVKILHEVQNGKESYFAGVLPG